MVYWSKAFIFLQSDRRWRIFGNDNLVTTQKWQFGNNHFGNESKSDNFGPFKDRKMFFFYLFISISHPWWETVTRRGALAQHGQYKIRKILYLCDQSWVWQSLFAMGRINDLKNKNIFIGILKHFFCFTKWLLLNCQLPNCCFYLVNKMVMNNLSLPKFHLSRCPRIKSIKCSIHIYWHLCLVLQNNS